MHLDHLGHPILGDRIYGQDPEVFLGFYEGRPLPDWLERCGHPRHCLHAWRLVVPHPEGEQVAMEAPLAADMATLLSD